MFRGRTRPQKENAVPCGVRKLWEGELINEGPNLPVVRPRLVLACGSGRDKLHTLGSEYEEALGSGDGRLKHCDFAFA